MEMEIKKKISQNKPIKVLFSGWSQLAHSYGIVLAFQLIHVYKNYGPNGIIKQNAIDIYVEEAEYFNKAWDVSKKQLVYQSEYNDILKKLKVWDGIEPVDLIYRQTYPYNISVHEENKYIPKCVFYTSEFAYITHEYFGFNKPDRLEAKDYDLYISMFLKEFDNIYFTSPSYWSSRGMTRFLENGEESHRNRIITHGVDTTIFKKHKDNKIRDSIRNKYNIQDTDILLINIGAMTTNKGILLILELMHILVNIQNRHEYKLMLKGSGDLYQCKDFLESYFANFVKTGKMTQKNVDYLLDNNIIFTSKTLSFNRINDLFNASDCYISPYLAEGFGLTMLESLSSGLPVIVPSTGSTKEFIEEIYQNNGAEYITYLNSQIGKDQNNLCQNMIKLEDLVDAVLNNNFKKEIPLENYNKMVKYIEKDLSWNKVSTLLYDYFTFILNRI